MTGEIIQFPRKRPCCFDCMNAAISVYGVHCLLFREDIFDEDVAQECEAFESQYEPGDPLYAQPTATEQ